MIARYDATWERVPGLLVLVPALIGMRGNVFGSLASRLSTELQTKKNSARSVAHLIAFFDRYILFEVLLLSLALALLSRAVHGGGVNVRELLFNNLVNAVLSGSLMLFCTKAVVRTALRHRLNPDNVAPIVVTSLGDTITIPCIVAIVTLGLGWTPPLGQYCVNSALLLATAGLVALQRPRWPLFVAIARQRIPILFTWYGLSCLSCSIFFLNFFCFCFFRPLFLSKMWFSRFVSC